MDRRTFLKNSLAAAIVAVGPMDMGLHLGLGGRPKYPGPWIASWTYDWVTGIWSPNPTIGSELLTNPNFDTDTNGWTGWPTNDIAAVAGGQSGKCVQITVGTGQTGEYCLQEFVLNPNAWYQFSTYQKNGSLTGWFSVADRANGSNPLGGFNINLNNVAWEQCIFSARAPGNATNGSINGVINGDPGNTTLFDSFSAKEITFADMFAKQNYGSQKSVSAKLVVPDNYHGGVFTRATSTLSSYLLAWVDRYNSKITLDAYYGSAIHNLIAATAITYGDNKIVQIKLTGANTVQLWYDGAQVGADKDISAMPAGTYGGMFGTGSGVQFNTFAAS